MANEQFHPSNLPFRTKRAVINSLGSTLALTEDRSGALIILDRAAGTAVTLPTTPQVELILILWFL